MGTWGHYSTHYLSSRQLAFGRLAQGSHSQLGALSLREARLFESHAVVQQGASSRRISCLFLDS